MGVCSANWVGALCDYGKAEVAWFLWITGMLLNLETKLEILSLPNIYLEMETTLT